MYVNCYEHTGIGVEGGTTPTRACVQEFSFSPPLSDVRDHPFLGKTQNNTNPHHKSLATPQPFPTVFCDVRMREFFVAARGYYNKHVDHVT